MSERTFPIWQSTLMRETGLPEEQFRRLRNKICKKSADYRVGQRNHIEFTEEGAQKMRAAATQSPSGPPDVPTPAPTVEKPAALPAPPIPPQLDVPMTISKIWPLNPRCLEATTKDGKLVTVRVKNSALLRRGMDITGRLVEGTIYDISSPVRPRV